MVLQETPSGETPSTPPGPAVWSCPLFPTPSPTWSSSPHPTPRSPLSWSPCLNWSWSLLVWLLLEQLAQHIAAAIRKVFLAQPLGEAHQLRGWQGRGP